MFDGGDVEEHDDFHTVKMSSLGFTIFPVAMLKNMPIFIRYKYKDEIAHACPIFMGLISIKNHHFIHRKMAKHSKFAMGAILIKIVIYRAASAAFFSASKTLQGVHPFRKNLFSIFSFRIEGLA